MSDTNTEAKIPRDRAGIIVRLTPLQLAAAEEACDEASNEMLIDMPYRQRRATKGAAKVLRRAFKESGAFWPW